MGIYGLWGVLSPVQEYRPLVKIGCDSVAVDLSMWICGDKSIGSMPGLHLRNLFFRLVSLLRQNTLPIAVLDGVAPTLKAGVMEHRQQKSMRKAAVPKDWKPNVNRTRFSKVSQECVQLLNSFGVPWVQSPGEAEAMCAFLNSNKVVDACITNDGDAFLYGAETVYRHFSMDSRDSSVHVYHMQSIHKVLNLTRSDLVLLSLLLGCDYWPNGVSRLGPVGALRLIASLKSEVSNVVNEQFLLKFLSWLINNCPKSSCEDFSRNPFGLHMNPSVIKLWLHVGVELKDCPYKEIFAEFLTSFEERRWTLPKRESISQWKRPDPRRIVPFCQVHLNWDPVYTLQHFLPIMALWDLRHPQILKSPSLIDYQIDDSIILQPLRIVKKRVVNYVESFEVEWKRLAFDKWTGQNNLNSQNETCQKDNIFKNGYYYFSVPQVEFCKVHNDLYSAFVESGIQKKYQSKKQKPKKTTTTAKKKQSSKTEKGQHLPIDELLKGLSISSNQINKNESAEVLYKASSVQTLPTKANPYPLWDSDTSSLVDDDDDHDDDNDDDDGESEHMNQKHLLPDDAINSEVSVGYKSDSEVLYNHTDCKTSPSSPPLSPFSSPSTSPSYKFKSAFPGLSRRRSSSLSNLINHCMLLKTSLLSNSMMSERPRSHSKIFSSSPSSSSIFSRSSSFASNNNNDNNIDSNAGDHHQCTVAWITEKFRTPKTLKDRLGVTKFF
ncbi:unnamed protein product [Trichobilharzia szidati]|nr:unnamed protein product [Trichobilharzia szidati]